MSGRLPYHVNQLILSSMLPGWDMPKEMTAMPKKLAQAGCKVPIPLNLMLSMPACCHSLTLALAPHLPAGTGTDTGTGASPAR